MLNYRTKGQHFNYSFLFGLFPPLGNPCLLCLAELQVIMEAFHTYRDTRTYVQSLVHF